MGTLSKMLLSCLILGLASSALANMSVCSPEPSVCAPTEVRCDSGYTGACWNGDYCMPEGSICPPACHIPVPTDCPDYSDIRCDNGADDNNCWMGDFCLPANNICPPACYPMQPS